MSELLIIGYGNPLRRDDGVGWHAANRLSEQWGHDPAITVLACHQLTPELAEPLSRARRALFLDAQSGGIPGRINRRVVLPEGTVNGAFNHEFNPSSLLLITQILYGVYPEAVLLSMVGADFGLGESFSAPVQSALDRYLGQVEYWRMPLKKVHGHA